MRGAGNPPNPDGLRSDYLWREVLTRASLSRILENYAQVVASRNAKTGKKKRVQIWPRYQQLDVVRRLLQDARTHGAGRRYLIQHSAGQRKELFDRLAGPSADPAGKGRQARLRLDHRRHRPPHPGQADPRHDPAVRAGGIDGGHAVRSGDLRRFITQGKKIIISTIQKFPFVREEISNEHRGRTFAMIIDEAHSSQGGKTSSAVSAVLGESDEVGRGGALR